MTGPTFIEYRNVEVEYPGHVRGLCGISLKIQSGDFVFFVGGSGAGKSTLIKLLTREVRHTKGTVLLRGQNLSDVTPWNVHKLRREMGIVPQDFALLPRKKVWENVAYAMRAVGHSRREVRKRVPQILDQVNVAHRADAFPHQLSGGEQQRVAIARALANDPPIVLADEPTGNLDSSTGRHVLDLLLNVRRARRSTLILVTHDASIAALADTRLTLRDGRPVDAVAPVTS